MAGGKGKKQQTFSLLLVLIQMSSLMSTSLVSGENSNSHPVTYEYTLLDQMGNKIVQKQRQNYDSGVEYSQTRKMREKEILSASAATPPVIEQFAQASGYSINFIKNQTATDDGSYVSMANNSQFTVNPVTSRYTSLYVDVDVYTQKREFTIEDNVQSSIAHQISSSDIYAQGYPVSKMAMQGTDTKIYGAVLSIPISGTAANLTLYVYNATLRADSAIVPHMALGSTDLQATSSDTSFIFKFTNPVTVSASSTYSTSTAGYFFFVLQRTDGASGNPGLGFQDDSNDGGQNDGPTYYYSGTGFESPPTNLSLWGSETGYDLSYRFNGSFIFDPKDIGTKVATPENSAGSLVRTNGIFKEEVTRTSTTTYTVFYNNSILPETTSINLTYVATDSVFNSASLDMAITPGDPTVSWQVGFSSTYDPTNTTYTKYFSIPNYYTITSVEKDGVLLNVPSDYVVLSSGLNQSVEIKLGAGNYIVNMTSPNELASSNLVTYANGIQSSRGYMGTLRSSSGVSEGKAGDLVKAEVTNVASLNLVGGTVNSSLRGNDGTIYPLRDIGTYTDSSVNTVEHAFSNNNISFETYLDPDMPVANYSFQHIWFNGTAAGAIASNFSVYPVVDITLMSPQSAVTVLEGSAITVEVLIHDRSHVNGSFSSAARGISWTHDTLALSYKGLYLDGYSYLYTGTVSTSKSTYPSLRPGNFTVSSTFSEGPFTASVEFNLEVFYRGDSSLSGPTTIEALSAFNISLTPLNVTDGGVAINTTKITISANSSIAVNYDPSSAAHIITVNWNPAFKLGTNVIQINWTLSDIRRDTLQPFQLDNFTFTVQDTALPLVDSPPDITYNETTTGHNITWSVSDTYPLNYTVFRDGSPLIGHDNANWNSGQITVSIDGLSKGVYVYSITIEDQAGQKSSDSVTVTVLDQTRPLLNSPNDISYNESSTQNKITWTASDTYAKNFTVYRNGTPYSSYINQTWTTGDIVVDIDGFGLGNWNMTLVVEDESGNIRSDTVWITVFDGTLPLAISSGDTSYNETTTGHVIYWLISDLHKQNYTVYQNGIPIIVEQSWTTDNVSLSIDGLSKGLYNFTILLQDTSGNQRASTILVTVFDGTLPEINHPGDVSYYEGQTGNNISWVTSDTYQLNYTVYVNGSARTGYINRPWVSSVILVDLDGFERGVYNLTIVVEDESGNQRSDTIILTVIDSIAPQLSNSPPPLVSFNESGAFQDLQWIVFELHPSSYKIYVNGTVVTSGNYTSLITFDPSTLEAGIYNISIVIFDDSLNFTINTLTVVIKDITPPSILSPEDVILEQGAEGIVTWELFDLHPSEYKILLNGSEFRSGLWDNNATLDIGVLTRGVYNITILVYDESGNVASDTVIVEIRDTTPPEIETAPPASLKIFRGNVISLNFSATDINPWRYRVIVNGSEIQVGEWTNGENISVLVDNFELGVFNLTVVFMDLDKNSLVITVTLVVKDPALIETANPTLSLTRSVKEGDVETIQYTWQTLNGSVIPRAKMEVSLLNSSGYMIVFTTFYSDNTGTFTIRLNYTSIPIGEYFWKFVLLKDGYEPKDLQLSVRIEKHSVDVSIDLPPELIQGQNYSIVVHVEYSGGGPSLDEITQRRSGGVEGLNVSIEITYVATDGTQTSITKKAITDADGNALFTLSSQETSLIVSLSSVTATVESDQFIVPPPYSVPESNLSQVVEKESNFLDWVLFVISVIQENITVFIGIFSFLVLLTSIIVVRSKNRKRKQLELKTRLKVASDEILALYNISAVLIRSRTGLPFFEENFETTEINIPLVSGITTAINSILSELRADEKGFETMVRSGLSITSHKGDYSTFVAISNTPLPEVILRQIERAHLAVEAKYGEDINDSVMINSISMQEVSDILESKGLKLSLKRFLTFDPRKITEIKKKTSINRIVRSNLSLIEELFLASAEADVEVTLSSLMEFLLARTESRSIASQVLGVAFSHGVISGNTTFNSGL